MFRFLRRFRARCQFVRAWRVGNWSTAIEACELLLKDSPDDYKVHNNLGTALLESGQATLAAKSFFRANELCEHSIHWNNLGRALLRDGHHDRAKLAFQRSIELDPCDPQPRYNLTVSLREEGRPDDAAAELRRFVDDFPKHAGGQNDLGCFWEEQGDRERAWTCYLRSVELAPGYLIARLNLIRVQCELGRYPEAMPHLQVLASNGMDVRVNVVDGMLEIDLNEERFYRGAVQK